MPSPSFDLSLKSGKSDRARLRVLASMIGWITSVLTRSPTFGCPFIRTMSANEAPFGITTAGSKSALLAYLSLTYLMNSMNRT